MMRSNPFTSRAFWGVLAVLAIVLPGCSTKEVNYPTQPPARNLDVQVTQPVTAAFTFTADSTGENRNVIFTDQSLGQIERWRWDFGDGGKSTAQNPVHKYKSPGVYVVSLTVSNAISSDTATQFVTVAEEQDEGASPTPQDPDEGEG